MRRLLFYILLMLVIGMAVAATLAETGVSIRRQIPADSACEESYDSACEDGYDTAVTALPDSLTRQIAAVVRDSISAADSTQSERPLSRLTRTSLRGDSLEADSSRVTFSRIRREKVDIEQPVSFTAKDSLVMRGQNNAFMYGNSTVKYGDINLNAGHIEMRMDSSTVYAAGVPDSVGKVAETPVFTDGSGEYQSKTMRYNFKTERGLITDVITEQGEGYLTGAVAKKMEDGSYNIAGGRYTTCDDHEHPHFYFQITKGKVRPKKNVVSGPVYMVLADVPLPLALPFGYFPFSKEYSSGIIFPSFGEDYNRGFYLRDGGYYFAINDNVDLALTGEIYTRGSWGLGARSNYVKRYKYRGNFNIDYITTIYGDKGQSDYSRQTNFRLAWTHTQDQKANPNLNFSASVNFTTSGYTRNDLNSYYSNAFTENTKSSTVNLTYRFPQSKWSLSATANISQRTQDSTLAVSFPNLTLTMAQHAPFRRKKRVGAERWYEKIRLSYSGQFQNSLTARQDEFFKKSLVRDWRNGMKHSVPISATFNIFKYINISPSINLNDRMYFSKVRRQWDPAASAEVCDTSYGFYNVFDFNAAISLDTKVYGFYKPLKIFGDKVQMIRHVITPTLTFSAAPDFGSPFWGYYGQYSRPTANGEMQTTKYSHFQHGIFGSPSTGKSGIVTLGIANNLEMKVKSDADSTGVKKISLIENFTVRQSYNFAADSLNWSNIETSILLRLTRGFNLNLSATWDPYTYALSSYGTPVRVNKTRLQAGKGWARLSSTGTSFSYTINNDTFRRKKDKTPTADTPDSDDSDDYSPEDFAAKAAARRERNAGSDSTDEDEDGYEKWSVPWSLSFNYSVNYSYGTFNPDKMEYNGKWTQNLSFNGSIQPTKNWNFNFSASYNIELRKIAYMNCTVSRDLHCFTMSASFVPVGPYKSYNFHIAVKSAMLRDLKYDKRSSNSNGITWY